MPKIDKNQTLKKEAKSRSKVFPKGVQTGSNGSPNPLISAKSAFQNAYTTKCSQSYANEAPQDSLQPQKLCSRLNGSIVFTFRLLPKSGPKYLPMALFWGPLASQMGQKSLKGPFKKATTNKGDF